MKPILWKSSFRYFLHHPWQLCLSILGVALGVGIVVSIDLTNESAKRSFALSVESLTGRATHQITGISGDLPETVYTQLRVEEGMRNSAPLVEGTLSLPDYPGTSFRILGIDPFAERPFRGYLNSIQSNPRFLPNFVGNTRGILISSETAAFLKLKEKEFLKVNNGEQIVRLQVVGILELADSLQNRILNNVLIADIAAAQEILGKAGFLSQINLMLPQGPARQKMLKRIEEILPFGAKVQTTSDRISSADKLTRSFHLNLTALSLLTLIVGVFLIYNTMTFSVVQRHSILGRLRALGMLRSELFILLLSEAFLVGSIGTLLGLGMGILLAQGLISLITQTINDLYYTVSVNQIDIPLLSVLKAVLLGIVSSLGAALIPAREAACIEPGIVIRRSSREESYRHLLPWLSAVGMGLLGLTGFLLWISSHDLIIVYIAVFVMVLGFALLMPIITVLLVNLASPLMQFLFKSPGILAARGVKTELSRTSVAIAALMVAIATSVGVGIMVESFRHAVVHWLTSSLQADIYLTSTVLTSQRTPTFLAPDFIEKASGLPGVKYVGTLRQTNVRTGEESMRLTAFNLPLPEQQIFRFKSVREERIWEKFQNEDITLISEPLSYRLNLDVGDSVPIQTPLGPRLFLVLGIFYDYGREKGYASISQNNYEKYWQDDRIHSIALYLEPGTPKQALISALKKLPEHSKDLLIRSNEHLIEYSIQVFDRTFAITRILRLLVVGVAFIGVLSALMALELEKQRELGVLRVVGLTPLQLWGVVMGQCGLMGVVSGITAFPIGYLLSQILIHVINKRSFGWTFQTIIPPEIWWQGFFLGLIAALFAGIYPAYKMARIAPADALREE
ncbi:MAG: ABC transporter permease [SAR324 cluster bacterium]|nr:ABC transporter permease [SAR324 cluster bacterium]